MERLKNMGLKKAFFLFSVCGLFVSFCLLAAVCATCIKLMDRYPSGGVAIDMNGTMTQLESPTPDQERIREILSVIPLLAAVLFPVTGLGVSGVLFYRWKLKEAICLLREGTERIRAQDLDFSFPAVSDDELGQVCSAFESMRAELQRTNRELWRQNEERKRLNAAFAHDLRNPVTVLKGTAKLLKDNREDAQAVERLEVYTERIGEYIEAMSSIQKLEQMPVRAGEVSLKTLGGEFKETAHLLCPSLCVELSGPETGCVKLDHGIVLTVAENLIGNGVRFAREKLGIAFAIRDNRLYLTVTDDGPGFPGRLLKDGPKPFEKGEESGNHFGMGLYSCSLLCEKHSGELRLENMPEGGARVTASFGVRYLREEDGTVG